MQSLNHQTIAIVEDDTSTLKALGRIVTAVGYRCELYSSAEELVRRGSLHELDCLLMDIELGGLSGLELHELLTLLGEAPPTIFVTGRTDHATHAQAFKQGCASFLLKPVRSDALQSAILDALH